MRSGNDLTLEEKVNLIKENEHGLSYWKFSNFSWNIVKGKYEYVRLRVSVIPIVSLILSLSLTAHPYPHPHPQEIDNKFKFLDLENLRRDRIWKSFIEKRIAETSVTRLPGNGNFSPVISIWIKTNTNNAYTFNIVIILCDARWWWQVIKVTGKTGENDRWIPVKTVTVTGDNRLKADGRPVTFCHRCIPNQFGPKIFFLTHFENITKASKIFSASLFTRSSISMSKNSNNWIWFFSRIAISRKNSDKKKIDFSPIIKDTIKLNGIFLASLFTPLSIPMSKKSINWLSYFLEFWLVKKF